MSLSLAQSPLLSHFTLKDSLHQCTTDDSLGPFSNCRFDFTLLFEQCFLSGIPSAILLIACAIRIHQLHRRDQKVVKNHVGLSKLVSSSSILLQALATHTTLGLRCYPCLVPTDSSHPLGQKVLVAEHRDDLGGSSQSRCGNRDCAAVLPRALAVGATLCSA